MRISITARHFDLTDGLREHTEERLNRLAKYGVSLLEAHAVLAVEKYRHRADITLHGNGFNLNGVSVSDDMYTSVDQVAQKLEAQVRRQKDKMSSRKQRGEPREGPARIEVVSSESIGKGEGHLEVLKSSEIVAPPLSLDEAILKLEQEDTDYLLFKNPISEKVSIVLRRKDGNYGVVEIG